MWWARCRAVLTFEVRAQRREPLTTLYALVFGLLALGYASSNAVELVRDRGSVPRTSAWALMLAFGGLTAFGQVITTMITTTAMLRDEAQRTRGLLATSGLGARTWFAGRVGAALVVMAIVYAAMPMGVLLGTALSGGDLAAAVAGCARAYAVITVPTVCMVTVLLACAALLTQRVLGVLATALVLLGLWQLSLGLIADPTTATLGALLDPFGNAPVLAATRGWNDVQKAHDVVPLAGLVGANRLLWVVIAGAAGSWVLFTHAPRAFAHSVPRAQADTAVSRRTVAPASSTATTAPASLRRFTASWMEHDGGWRVVSALAVLNALFNAMVRDIPDHADGVWRVAASLLLVSEHARVFLILLATVYAGELVWRERDVRVNQLVDTMPVSHTSMAWGRMQGLLMAQRTIVVPLAVAALVVAVWRHGITLLVTPMLWQVWVAWSVFVLWLPFAQLTVLSLAVHVWLDHKVLAHLLLITGWVIAIVLDTKGVAVWWVRFAEPATLMQGHGVAWGDLALRGGYWSAGSAGLLLWCARRWRRGLATERRLKTDD